MFATIECGRTAGCGDTTRACSIGWVLYQNKGLPLLFSLETSETPSTRSDVLHKANRRMLATISDCQSGT